MDGVLGPDDPYFYVMLFGTVRITVDDIDALRQTLRSE